MLGRLDWEEKYGESVAELEAQNRESSRSDQDEDEGPEIRESRVSSVHVSRTEQRAWNGFRRIDIHPGDTYRRIRVREYVVGGEWQGAWTMKKVIKRAEMVA